MPTKRLPKLPDLLQLKLYKTGQTRGADDDDIEQNRVGRSNTVLIPYECWDLCAPPREGPAYEKDFIVLLKPPEYFGNSKIKQELARKGLAIGHNALVYYEKREAWKAHDPDALNWVAAQSRRDPLGGQYVARIAGTTAAKKGDKIIRGFNVTKQKGAGIRVFEYASRATIADCRLQLEALFWICKDADRVVASNGMTIETASIRKAAIFDKCRGTGLLDSTQLTKARILNARGRTICPLCLEELSAQGFFKRMEQAEGRAVHDLTVTELNLFHIAELRYGVLNHRPYNVGWGHHHCNVVVRDLGIQKTLEWARRVVKRNAKEGHLPAENNDS